MYTDLYYFSLVLGQTHRDGYSLIDRMVELRYTLMSPVFTQLWENLSQSIRSGKRVETEIIYRAEHFHTGCQ